MIRTLIVDDEPLARERLRTLLQPEPDIQIIGECADGRQAVMADPDWHHGRYFERSTHPHRGLAVARMAGHITYLSDAALHRKFGRRMQDRELPTFSFDADFQVESYLRYQGSSFVERFDANSYLYLTRAMDYFDIAADHSGVLAQAFRGIKTRFCVVSFTSDWLFPTAESRALVHALNASSARVSFAEIETDRGVFTEFVRGQAY